MPLSFYEVPNDYKWSPFKVERKFIELVQLDSNYLISFDASA